MSMRVLIVDDEPLARQRLQRLLRSEPDVELLAPCADGRAAVAAIREHMPDLLFLDVQMPGMSGFEVLGSVGPKRMPVVIFVTAHDRFALQAFEAEAIDYLLKPFGAERVTKALARARNLLAGGARRLLEQQYAGLVRATAGAREEPCVLVRKRERMIVLRAGEIDLVEADGDYVRVCAGTETHLLRGTLADMERRLAPAGFVRIHRSRLVNLQRVREFIVDREHDPAVLLKDGRRLDASVNYLRRLQLELDPES
ncbi:MAG TPA: response regulator [Steroidobacteraceae bacterium]|nr:response regulator [Steroidobacteraceae bacterium]